jgi:hypothetical protein
MITWIYSEARTRELDAAPKGRHPVDKDHGHGSGRNVRLPDGPAEQSTWFKPYRR